MQVGHELPGLVWAWKEAVPVLSQAAQLGQLCSTPWSLQRARSTLSISTRVPRGLCQPLSPGSVGARLWMCSSRQVTAWARICSSFSRSAALNGERT